MVKLILVMATIAIAGSSSAQEIKPPSDQNMFLSIVEEHRVIYDNAENDMQAGAARPARGKAICQLLRKRVAKDWIGTVATLSTNGDGNGVLTINIGADASVSTWNTAFADAGDNTLIPFDSPLFSQATKLAEGQPVKFSGTFFREKVDCIREMSVTMGGSMSSPAYLMRFESVEAIGPVPKKSSFLKSLFE